MRRRPFGGNSGAAVDLTEVALTKAQIRMAQAAMAWSRAPLCPSLESNWACGLSRSIVPSIPMETGATTKNGVPKRPHEQA